ncbi:MAG: preprotein translocase subunit SecG [Phycisphaerales bacterium]|nr:preprotein translocase subunit SecG [Phycisphaerales bacterium]
MSVFFTVLTFLFMVVSLALVLVILVQRPQGGGLASAFGGGGGTDTAFGGRTGDALTVGTVSVFVVYLILAMALNIFNPQSTLMTEETAKSEAAKAIPSVTMPAPVGSTAPATATPVTTDTTAPIDGAAPIPATSIPAPAIVAPTAPTATEPTTAPAAVAPVVPENPKHS